jgi:opacity protein-like surface antigen
MMMKKCLQIVFLLVVVSFSSAAQKERSVPRDGKAWEFGLGGSVYQFSRTSFSDFQKTDDKYEFYMQLSHVVWGGNLYVARELNPHLYLDMQGTVGLATDSSDDNGKRKWFYTIGAGVQWRLGNYFGSRYIDPYLRAGIGYMYRDFRVTYSGSQAGVEEDELDWLHELTNNRDGYNRKHLMPVSLGIGLQM